MALDHDVPTALGVRPTVTIRQIPGKLIRVPARSGTLLLIAVLTWGIGVALIHLPWHVLAGVILTPAGLLALLVELKPHGKSGLGWAYILIRHWRRSPVLLLQRLAASAELRRLRQR
jgi:hypothetical protein